MSIIASPYPSHWCLLLGSAGVSPPPSGPHDRPSAWLCSPARKEEWSLIAELQGRVCPRGNDPSQEGREISRARVQGRTVALQWLGSGWSGAREPLGSISPSQIYRQGLGRRWCPHKFTQHTSGGAWPRRQFVYVPGGRSAGTGSLLVLDPPAAPHPAPALLLTRSWKSTVAPLSRSFSRISMWPSREARCRAVRRNCPQRNSQGPSLTPSSTQIETRAYPSPILTPVLDPHMVHILPAPSCSVGTSLGGLLCTGDLLTGPQAHKLNQGMVQVGFQPSSSGLRLCV